MIRGLMGKKDQAPKYSPAYLRGMEILSIVLQEDPQEVSVELEHFGRITHFGIRFNSDDIRRVKNRLAEIRTNDNLPIEDRKEIKPLPPVMRISIYNSLIAKHDDVFHKLILSVNGRNETIVANDLSIDECFRLEARFKNVLSKVQILIEGVQAEKNMNAILGEDESLRKMLNLGDD